MGKAHKTTDPEPDALQSFLDGDRDSTLADLAASRNTFREFVIYDADQVYPEYVILYKRLHQDAEPEPLPKELPFLLELPLYWKNVCENPHHPGFREHCFVKPQIHDLIKRLANGTASIGGPYEVVKVTRVEDSILWLRYMETKGQLTELAKRTPFKLPNDSWNQRKKHFFFSTFDSWSLQRHGMMALVGRISCSVLLGDQFFLKIFPSEFGKVVWFSDPHIFWKKSPTSWTSVSRCLLRETFNVSGSNMLVSGSTCFWWSIGTLNHNSWIDHS